MEQKIVYRNSFGLRRTWITDDAQPERAYGLVEQDLEPIFRSIARDQDIMAQNGDMRLTHRIPTIIYEDLQRKGITEDESEFRKWLNGPEGRVWRIWGGSV